MTTNIDINYQKIINLLVMIFYMFITENLKKNSKMIMKDIGLSKKNRQYIHMVEDKTNVLYYSEKLNHLE